MMEIKEEELKPGYNYDPFAGEENAPFFLGTWIGKITGNPDGFISSTREWHILWEAIWAGARAKTLENVPDCPPLWRDEDQLWKGTSLVVNVVKCQWPSVVIVLGAFSAKIGLGI